VTTGDVLGQLLGLEPQQNLLLGKNEQKNCCNFLGHTPGKWDLGEVRDFFDYFSP